MNVDALLVSDVAHLVHPLTNHRIHALAGPQVLESGEGVWLRTRSGQTLLDGTSGLWCVSLGYGRTDLIEAATSQLHRLPYATTFSGTASPPAIELAEKLVDIAPRGIAAALFTSGGSEANESAFKIARHFWYLQGRPNKTFILSHDRGYHGTTLAAMTATGLAAYHAGFGPLAPDHARVYSPYSYHCAAGTPCTPEDCEVMSARALASKIEEIGPHRIAAFIAEPIIGTGGVIVPPRGYLSNVRAVCDRYEVLLITDEVVTGFGRSGALWGSNHDDVQPDLITFGKGVTGGYVPFGGVLVTERVWDALHNVPGDLPLMHGFTHSGHPVGCAVALATIRAIETERIVDQVRALGDRLQSMLNPLRNLKEVGDIRSIGLMTAIELVADQATRANYSPDLRRGAAVVAAARRQGLIVRALLGDSILLAPPLTISEEELRLAVERLEQAIVESEPKAA